MPNTILAEQIGEYATDRKGRKLSKNRLLRRALIMQKTLDLVAARGYDAVTVDELAAAGQVTKKTLYDIYGSKQAVVAQAVALRLDGLVDSLLADLDSEGAEKDGLTRLLAMVRRTCEAVLETPELSRALATRLVRSADEFHLTRFFERLHRAAIEQMKADRQIHGWVNVDFTVRSMMFDQIAVQSMWAGGNIRDDQYAGFARLSALRIITPLARASLRSQLVEQIRTMQQELRFGPEQEPEPAPEPDSADHQP